MHALSTTVNESTFTPNGQREQLLEFKGSNLNSGNEVGKVDSRSALFGHANERPFKGPWVPAPAKASGSIPEIINKPDRTVKHNLGTANASSSSSYSSLRVKKVIPSSNVKSKSTTSIQKRQKEFRRYVRKPTSKTKQAIGRRYNVESGHRLKTKDSLVDVTACLHAKRSEVMKLWKKALPKGDPNLLSQIENANRLALEATEDVEVLRKTIQKLQQKDEGLTDGDCAKLEEMRSSVLEKVKKFEDADTELQELLNRRSASKTSLISAGAVSKMSQTEINPRQVGNKSNVEVGKGDATISVTSHIRGMHSNQSKKELIILKEQPQIFSGDESSSESDKADNEEISYHPIVPIAHQNTSRGHSAVTSVENLRYPKNPKAVHQNSNKPTSLSSKKSSRLPNDNYLGDSLSFHQRQTNMSHQREVRFTNYPEESESETFPANIAIDELYREKIGCLQRKLMYTEQEVEELKADIERIESDANFRVRMLQNTVQDKFDSLKVIPEYLQMVDHKLHETATVKVQLQHTLQEKETRLSEEKSLNHSMRKEKVDLLEKIKDLEHSKNSLMVKNSELEKNNHQLRFELDHVTKQMAAMSAQIFSSNQHHNAGMRSPRRSSSLENQRLKLQCSEFKEQLAQAKKIIQFLKKTKSKVTQGLNERIDQLISALEQAQDHKRQLCDQIRYLKKSYNELFPPAFFHSPPQKKSSHFHSSKSSKKVKAPAKELIVEPEVAWQTFSQHHNICEDEVNPIQSAILRLQMNSRPLCTEDQMFKGNENENETQSQPQYQSD